MERKLTAIFSADVKGYSRLMGEDEEGTLLTLTAYRQLIDTLLAQYRGRFVGAAGDSVLAEFASVVDAVQCAVAIQTTLKAENARLPPDRKMEFRIGINLGDVLVAGDQIYGDGVNIAARVESLAAPGGICISGTVHEHIRNKLTLHYEDCGAQQVKNIAEPVRVYRLVLEVPSPHVGEGQGEGAVGEAEGSRFKIQSSKSTGQDPKFRRVSTAVLVLVSVLVLGGLGIVWYFFLPTPNPQSPTPSIQALPLPDKPSIAVLPFTNMSGDPEQDWFSDGMTDTLITDLSKLSGLFVIARNSVFAYKGEAAKIQQVSQELGVRYVLEGSVQRAADKVRINAQLVDATTGHHLWAERYDGERKDIFALQDEITQKVVAALEVKLTAREQERGWHRYTNNVEAYDYLLRGWEYLQRFTPETNTQARQQFEKVLALDPKSAAAYAALSVTYEREWGLQWSQDLQTLERALTLAQQAVALDDSLSAAHLVLGNAYQGKRQLERARAEFQRAIALDPNNADGYEQLAELLNLEGRPEEALGLIERAMRLNPSYPAEYLYDMGVAHRLLGHYEEAITAQKRALTRNPDFVSAHADLVRIYHELGKTAEAQAAEAEVQRLNPNFPLESLREEASLKTQKEAAERLFKHSLTDNLTARAYFYGGFAYYFRYTPEAQAQAQQMWKHAIELDPQFAAAHTVLAGSYLFEWMFLWSQDPQTLERVYTLARRAVALDDSSALAHQMLATAYLLQKQYEQALIEAERTIVLAPEDGDGYWCLGTILLYAGQTEEAIEVLKKGEHLNPRFLAALLATLGRAYARLGRYTEALDTLNRALPLNPHWLQTHAVLAVTYSELDRMKEAQAEVAEILRLSPEFSLEGLRQILPYKDPAEIERVLAALRKAGLE